MPEYYVFKAKPDLMAREAISILKENRLPQMRKDLEEVQRILGGPGASDRAAEEVLKSI
jgi:lipid A disaccharide synthetase